MYQDECKDTAFWCSGSLINCLDWNTQVQCKRTCNQCGECKDYAFHCDMGMPDCDKDNIKRQCPIKCKGPCSEYHRRNFEILGMLILYILCLLEVVRKGLIR